jgi:glycosyltransferase involved in cell wall biosynthesis
MLSIITINFNNFAGLSKTIESVLNQTFTYYEYIIIDGASTDGSTELLKKHSEKLKYWVSEPDNGIYNAMNKGIKIASGEYLLFLNSGDYLSGRDTLEKISGYINDEDIIYGNGILETKDGKFLLLEIPESPGLEYFSSNSLHHPSTLIKKRLFEQYGLYNEANRIVSDWEFFIKTILLNNVLIKKIPISISVNEENGISRLKENEILLKEEINSVLKKYFPLSVLSLLEEYCRMNAEIKRIKKTLIGKLLFRFC